MINNIISNISSKISYINSKMPTDLPGSISGGIFGRELLIKSLSLDTKEEDSNATVGLKTAANLAIRLSSIAFSLYNPVSLPYFTAFTNPLMAIGKGYQACALYSQGKEYDNEQMIDEAKKKTLEVAKHVALSVVDYWTLGLVDSSKIFDIAAAGYTLVGTALDITRSSEKVHDKLFDPDFIRLDADDSDDEDSFSERISSDEEGDLFRAAGEDCFRLRGRFTASSSESASSSEPRRAAPLASDDYIEDDDGFVEGGEGYSSSDDESDTPLSASASPRRRSSSGWDAQFGGMGRKRASELRGLYEGERSVWGIRTGLRRSADKASRSRNAKKRFS